MTDLQMSVFDFMRLASLMGILIISNIFLNRWEPKLKEQFRALIILAIGIASGYVLANSMVLGFVTAGFVLYGVSVTDEINRLKDCFKTIDKKIDKKIDTKIKEIEEGDNNEL